ncbi:MAG TPA: ABC transporter ATP-binding protein [Chthonomonadaceae bacterium]|nr:ABC transporter ATP-binding protein [Chthonomonadaceae bacterium]
MQTEANNAFTLHNVCYRYGEGVDALEDISLTIGQGEKIAILGANGCGKSTLLKLLDGLLFPQSGTLTAFGESLSAKTLADETTACRFRRRVGYLFQNADVQLFCPTVRDEIAFGPLQMGLPRDEVAQRVQEVAALFGLTSLLDRTPFQLSGGEKKKVALAGVLAINPDVLLLDEPTGGLDPRSQGWLVDLLARLHAAGKTLVTATHDLHHVPLLADRAVVLSEDHRIVAEGPSAVLLADLRLLEAANLLHMHLHRHGDLIHSHPHFHSYDHEHTHDENTP